MKIELSLANVMCINFVVVYFDYNFFVHNVTDYFTCTSQVSPTPGESSSHLIRSSLQPNSKRAKGQSSFRFLSDSESDDDSVSALLHCTC